MHSPDFYEKTVLSPLSDTEFTQALTAHFSHLEASEPSRIYGTKFLLATLADILRRYADFVFTVPSLARGACRIAADIQEHVRRRME